MDDLLQTFEKIARNDPKTDNTNFTPKINTPQNFLSPKLIALH